MQFTSRNTSHNYQAKICVLLQEKTYTFLLTCSKVTRPLIESRITPLVIPPELQTSKTVKPAVCFFTS